jgi:EAL domain-containing protein (putative c-di-GMP-specific phosphodiesterase class I)
LKKLPIDGLKIDRTFVKDIPHGLKDSAITASTVTLAKQLHMRVVAEGVETEEQLQYLKQIGCSEIQGFIVSKPETAGVIASRFR